MQAHSQGGFDFPFWCLKFALSKIMSAAHAAFVAICICFSDYLVHGEF